MVASKGICVIGIGQSFRGDDAAGLVAVSLWKEKFPDTARQVYIEILDPPEITILSLLKDAQSAILIDACQVSKPAGSLLILKPEELASFSGTFQFSHQLGIAEALQIGFHIYPELNTTELILIGIVGKNFTIGTDLSHQVREGLQKAIDLIENEVQSLLR